MMDTERRVELKRMQIEKPIALFVPGKKKAYRGTTRNMSDAGICAGFKKLPKNGDDVMLHVFWQEGSPPIEQPARLVWSNAKAVDGRTRVGLQLRDEPQGTPPEPTPRQKPERVVEKPAQTVTASQPTATQIVSTCPTIERGGEVRLLIGGVAVEAVASTVGEIRDDNTVEVVLEITDPAFTGEAAAAAVDGEAPPEEQDWTPHPFRDAWRATAKVLGPTARIVGRYSRIVALTVATAVATLFHKIKNRTPKKLSA